MVLPLPRNIRFIWSFEKLFAMMYLSRWPIVVWNAVSVLSVTLYPISSDLSLIS